MIVIYEGLGQGTYNAGTCMTECTEGLRLVGAGISSKRLRDAELS